MQYLRDKGSYAQSYSTEIRPMYASFLLRKITYRSLNSSPV